MERMLYGYCSENPIRELGGGDYLPNVWRGVTAENQRRADERLPLLLNGGVGNFWLSAEPLLGAINIAQWLESQLLSAPYRHLRPALGSVVVGCESGPGRRPMQLKWAVNIVRQCWHAGVPCYVKQIEVDGKVSHNPAEWPEELRVRQVPWKEIA